MKPAHLLILAVLITCLAGPSPAFAQDQIASNSVSLISPEDKLHALALTRFHFITLKQFQNVIFQFVGKKKALSEIEAEMINAGLNQFLESAERETMLLEAMRKNEPVKIEFPEYDETIEVKPLLDQPIAFQIALTRDSERHLYNVDWSGNVILQNN